MSSPFAVCRLIPFLRLKLGAIFHRHNIWNALAGFRYGPVGEVSSRFPTIFRGLENAEGNGGALSALSLNAPQLEAWAFTGVPTGSINHINVTRLLLQPAFLGNLPARWL